MSLEERFSKEELFTLTNAPYLVGTAMVFAEGSGFGTLKEMFANSKSFLMGAKEFPNNEIISGILPDMHNFSEATEKSKEFQEKVKELFKSKGITSLEQMQSFAKEELNKAINILESKATPKEIDDYKEWVLSIASNVAKAAKEGGFLGFGGELISDNEEAFYAQIAEILGKDSTLS